MPPQLSDAFPSRIDIIIKSQAKRFYLREKFYFDMCGRQAFVRYTDEDTAIEEEL
jgi:hypothetical protein